MSKEDVTIMAEAFNLLMQATFNEVKGDQLAPAGVVISNFQELIQRYAEKAQQEQAPLLVDEDVANETE